MSGAGSAPEAPERVVRRFLAAVGARDVEAIAALHAADAVLIDSLGDRLCGRTAIAGAWRGYFELFPDYRIEVEELVAAGGTVAVFGWAAATCAPSPAGSESAWRIPAAWRAVVADGRLAEWQVYADNRPVRARLEGATRARRRG